MDTQGLMESLSAKGMDQHMSNEEERALDRYLGICAWEKKG